jgi:hypothetical protein
MGRKREIQDPVKPKYTEARELGGPASCVAQTRRRRAWLKSTVAGTQSRQRSHLCLLLDTQMSIEELHDDVVDLL